jgi:homoprotocatechuate degradation regulator HpaR
MTPRRTRRTDAAATHATAVNAGEHGEALAARELPMRAFSKSLPMQLLRAREAVMRPFRPGLRMLDVTEQQWRVLRALAHSGPLEASELARTTCLLAPSLSRILPGMEARELILRRQVDSDLRRWVISLDRKGLRLLALHAPYSEKIYEEIARRFGAERLAQLFTLLRELEASAQLQEDAAVTASPARPRARAVRRLRKLDTA